MAYPSSYNTLIDEWFNNPTDLAKSDAFLSTQSPGVGLLWKNYYNSMPEPIMGDLDNNIAVLLNLNPGYTGEDNKKGYPPDEVVLGRTQMRPLVSPDYETYAKPFPHLCANPHHKAAADWWLKRQKWLEKMAFMYNGYKASHTEGLPDLKPVALELCPFHSKEWPEARTSSFSPAQRIWIEDNPFAAARTAVAHSKLPFIISIGKPIYEAALQLGFTEIKKWSSSLDSAVWPKNSKGEDKQKTFVVLERNMGNGSTLKMLNIWSMFQRTPADDFDPVIKEVFKYL